MEMRKESPRKSRSLNIVIRNSEEATQRHMVPEIPTQDDDLLSVCDLVFEIAQAKSYIVGDNTGWNFEVESWPKGKKFMAGDILVFQYLANSHNVVKVNHQGYRTCSVPRGSFMATSGNDHIKLVKGNNYFICNFPEHCSSGMRIAVFAN
ncbi:basic blue protein-like [Telopea speciosissima]|uniref:basic blue protein-like n=1 Tax=Telopea speciosissima TaxID=54955 RepID=UPI001CC6A212|nr:basic blue protein-like [Telopea speciosissima]